ncbi:MAG: MOSC N-terminal beta barrel domain-containing protein [Saccharospirillaceae bacterium]|nr:MOSC N-terminal beta barrel domain-containing protein [Saccharospirillaceae bacterium]
MSTVQALYIYPVKSLGGISINSMSFDKLGPVNDRRYMLIDKNGFMMTQRDHPILAKFNTALNNQTLTITFDNNSININLEQTSNKNIAVEIWGDNISGFEVHPTISQWFSQKIESQVRFIKFNQNTPRIMDRDFVDFDAQVAFADGFQILLTQHSSLEALELGNNEDMLRFRPNIVAQGNNAFDEDYWRTISINQCEFAIVKPCERCSMPAVNPKNGTKQPKVIRALAQKRLFHKGMYFGQNLALISQNPSIIKVGEPILIKEKSNHSNIKQ